MIYLHEPSRIAEENGDNHQIPNDTSYIGTPSACNAFLAAISRASALVAAEPDPLGTPLTVNNNERTVT